EGEAVLTHRWPGADDQRDDDATEDQEHRNRGQTRDPVEADVAELERTERPGAVIGAGGFYIAHIALNGHVCHANPLSCLARDPGHVRWARLAFRYSAPCGGTSTLPHARGRVKFTRDETSALDLGRPGLLDQLDHVVRHRDVVELFGHLAAVGKSP